MRSTCYNLPAIFPLPDSGPPLTWKPPCMHKKICRFSANALQCYRTAPNRDHKCEVLACTHIHKDVKEFVCICVTETESLDEFRRCDVCVCEVCAWFYHMNYHIESRLGGDYFCNCFPQALFDLLFYNSSVVPVQVWPFGALVDCLAPRRDACLDYRNMATCSIVKKHSLVNKWLHTQHCTWLRTQQQTHQVRLLNGSQVMWRTAMFTSYRQTFFIIGDVATMPPIGQIAPHLLWSFRSHIY